MLLESNASDYQKNYSYTYDMIKYANDKSLDSRDKKQHERMIDASNIQIRNSKSM